MDSLSKILKFAQSNKYVFDSIEIVKESLGRFKPDNVCISFNGGKDCTALLHLVHSVARDISPEYRKYKFKVFYAQLPHHFEEESAFVAATVQQYNLKLMQYETNSLKESLQRLKEDDPAIEAIYIGTRNDDLKPGILSPVYAPTDPNWPKFLRINPILNWSYTQVWSFIRELDIHYCDLYNQGYSSIGTKLDTSKNPSLLKLNQDGSTAYLPAWELVKSNDERLSRSSSLAGVEKELKIKR